MRKQRLSDKKAEYWSWPETAEEILRGRRELGKQLRLRRRALELSREDAAETIGIHPVQLARIESSEANFTISTLLAIALAYKTTLRDILVEVPLGAVKKPRRAKRGLGVKAKRDSR